MDVLILLSFRVIGLKKQWVVLTGLSIGDFKNNATCLLSFTCIRDTKHNRNCAA